MPLDRQLERGERTFPPMFDEVFGGMYQYAMGMFGRYLKIGPAYLHDNDAVADLIVSMVPEDSLLRPDLRRQVVRYLKEYGSQTFMGALLGTPGDVPDGRPSRGVGLFFSVRRETLTRKIGGEFAPILAAWTGARVRF